MLCSCVLMRPCIRPGQLSSRIGQGIRLLSYLLSGFFFLVIQQFVSVAVLLSVHNLSYFVGPYIRSPSDSFRMYLSLFFPQFSFNDIKPLFFSRFFLLP